MKEFFSNLGPNIGGFLSSANSFLKGKKRFIAIGLGLIGRIIPKHTAVGQGAGFILDNLDNIQIGLDVGAALFAGAAIAEKVKEKLPSGLSGKMKEEGKL